MLPARLQQYGKPGMPGKSGSTAGRQVIEQGLVHAIHQELYPRIGLASVVDMDGGSPPFLPPSMP